MGQQLAYLVFLCACKPYMDPKINTLEFVNEYVVLATHISISIMVDASIEPDVMTKVGATAGFVVSTLVGVSFTATIWSFIKNIYRIFQKFKYNSHMKKIKEKNDKNYAKAKTNRQRKSKRYRLFELEQQKKAQNQGE